MTARGDDDPSGPSDPVLDSMRSVWLAMRDEDPPTAGLSQLLAAARAKAEAMQPKPSWWRRALLALRRPPVLALATTLVLLGGAVLVASRQDKLGRTNDVAPAVVPAPAGSAAATPPGTAPVPDPASGEGQATVQPEQDRDSQTIEHAKPERPAPERRRETSRTAPAPRPRPAPPHHEEPPVVEQRAAEPPPPPPPPPPPVTANRPTERPPSGPSPAAGRGNTGGDFSTSKDAPAKAPDGFGEGGELELKEAQVQDDEAKVATQNRGSRGPTVEQLARQSTTAAAHGDCPAVRAITSRMQKLDQAAYRAHVANNATVKSCLGR